MPDTDQMINKWQFLFLTPEAGIESDPNYLFLCFFLSSIVRPIPSSILSLSPQTRLNKHPLSPCRLGFPPYAHFCPHNPSHNQLPLRLSWKTRQAVFGWPPPAMGLSFQAQEVLVRDLVFITSGLVCTTSTAHYFF